LDRLQDMMRSFPTEAEIAQVLGGREEWTFFPCYCVVHLYISFVNKFAINSLALYALY
jgi:hypothetical protein